MSEDLLRELQTHKGRLLRRLMEEKAKLSLGDYDGEEWAEWLLRMFPGFFCDPSGEFTGFADFHADFWRHVHGIKKGSKPEAYVGIQSRDTGKSTNAEIAVAYVGCEKTRRYAFYVCGTQDQADDHVSNIASLLEGSTVSEHYPLMGERQLTKFGNSRGWRINRLRTASGFVVDAIGLDKAIRGKRLDEMRPDLVILDDIDDDSDTPRTVSKKERKITRSILPAMSADGGVIFVQNLIHSGSVANRIVTGAADFLANRKLSGPHPAILDLKYETYIEDGKSKARLLDGTPTWQGLDLERAQAIVDDIGITSFLVEHQHEMSLAEGMFLGGVWSKSVHVVKPTKLPEDWKVFRGYDYGSSKPYAVVWVARSDGDSPLIWPGREPVYYPKGSLHVIAERYGMKDGKPNVGTKETTKQIAAKIKKAEKVSKTLSRAKPGPADLPAAQDGESVEDRFRREGVIWEKPVKGPGSRVTSAQKVLTMLQDAVTGEGPGLYVWETCPNVIRTFPILPKDELDADDVDTEAEDHLFDAIKMLCVMSASGAKKVKVTGQ